MSRSSSTASKRFATLHTFGLVACALVVCACGKGAEFPTASELPDEPRRPDGIAVDLSSEPPVTRDRAESSDALVTLRTPLGTEVALATVRAFFEAMVNEDTVTLDKLISSDARMQDTRTRPAAPSSSAEQTLSGLWRDRFTKHEFKLLTPALLYREGDITAYRKEQLDALPIAVRYLGPPRTAIEPTDVVLHVPIVTHTVKSERLLGDDMYFWLRREADRYLIYRMAEDLPY
jgi:hypothetical protein